ncbi:MAG: hypothetical protein L6Q51_14425 [Cyclobacteriaceae bacterium]|nr:hypothetical protein [Cytophagales bacterium]MCK6618830.1 hypothetical protein [Cyclobacteriaceae bacterium]
MKKFRTILTGILASLVLMSSISHSVSFHLCGGEVQSMAIFGHAQACEEHTRGCDHDGDPSDHTSVGHKGCCEDATVIIDSEKYSTKVSETITIKPLTDGLPLIIPSVEHLNSAVAVERGHFFNYRPPLIERDITILVQTFLI